MRVHRRRRAVTAAVVVVAAVPAALGVQSESQAAPTLAIAEAEGQLSALQTQEGSAAEAYDAGQIALDKANTAATAADQRVASATARLATMRAGVASFARSAYTGDGLDPIETLLAGGDPQSVVHRTDALNKIAAVHADQLRAVQAQQVTLTAAQKTAADQRTAASASVEQLAAKKASIDKIIAQEQQVLSRLQAQQRQALLAEQARQQAASRAAARTVLQTAATTTTQRSVNVPIKASGNAAQVAVQAALSQQGKPYVYGAAGPSSYDCSGLVMWAYAHAGISLPHNAAAQYNYGTHVSPSQLEPGDIVFFEENGGIGHNGIYVGNGQMVDANHTGGWVGVRNLYPGLIGGTRL